MDSKQKQKIFIPLTIDKRFWNKDMPNVFLNKVYEAQIGSEDKDLQYTTLQTSYTYAKDERFQNFCDLVIVALGEVLNQYHRLNENNRFWRLVLWLWVQEYATSMRFKIEQFENLRKKYPETEYKYYTYSRNSWNLYQFFSRDDVRNVLFEEEYHFMGYSWLAQRYFDFDIMKKTVDSEKKKTKSNRSSFLSLFNKMYIIFRQSITYAVNRAIPSKARVGLCHAQFSFFARMKWLIRSHGAIQEVSIPVNNKSYELDINFREELPEKLMRCVETKAEKIIIEFLPYILPSFFVENFRKQHDAASDYLQRHKNIVLIDTLTSLLDTNAEKICMVLLKKRGGKIIGQQHGGTYQATTSEQEHMRELEWNDMFYYWGKSALKYRIEEFPDCKILYGPSYKFYRGTTDRLRRWIQTVKTPFLKDPVTTRYFLFVGTVVEAYPRAFSCGNVDGDKWEYIHRKFRFFSSLNETARRKMIVREFPKDHGWHMKEKIGNRFPDLKVSYYGGFNNLLDGCVLFISDALSTPWIEAIYIEKPVIFLLFDHEVSVYNCKFRKEEKKYIDMLVEVGIIIYSPEEAAQLVNRLVKHGVMKWWMDEERQRVIRLVRERWTTKVNDIDEWWYRELMAQAKDAE